MTAKRKAWGTDVAQPTPFTIFEGKHGKVGVRIGTSKPFISVSDVRISAPQTAVVIGPDGRLRISGEGVVRRHGDTVAILP